MYKVNSIQIKNISRKIFLSIEIHYQYQMDNFLCTLGARFEVFMAVTMKTPEVSNLHRVDVLYL